MASFIHIHWSKQKLWALFEMGDDSGHLVRSGRPLVVRNATQHWQATEVHPPIST